MATHLLQLLSQTPLKRLPLAARPPAAPGVWLGGLLAACLSLPSVAAGQPAAPAAANKASVEFFESRIRPVLVEHCYQCHSDAAAKQEQLEAGLRLDTRAGIRRGGDSGPAVAPGDPQASLLVKAIRHDTLQMPPDSKLPDRVIADFVKWIADGAVDPREGDAATSPQPAVDFAEARQFWSFRPLQSIAAPAVDDPWVRTDADRFVLRRLRRQQLRPNDEADRRTLIRRLYYGLWGLPPAPEDVRAFLADESPAAYDRLVDRLLEGPAYGERWARHWLDLARFAESNGYAFDKDRPAAFHYRDFVIKALNQDLPYDRFVQLQIAGDQMATRDYMAQAATGFLAAGPFTSQQTQKERERSRYEQLDDVAATIGTAMLGLTIGCARCHDHKFDPLPTRDYYRFVACFAKTGFQDYGHDPDPSGTLAAKQAFDREHQPLVDARVRYEREQLPAALDAWLATKSEPPAAEKLGVWHVIGPFPADSFAAAFKTAFPPEKKIELDKPVDQLRWTEQPDWVDGKVHNTLRGDNSANYLYRTIEAPRKMTLPVSLGRDDAIKLFLNGKQVLAKQVSGAAAPDQDQATLSLKAGVNHLLLKIVNGAGPSGFYFSTRPAVPPKIQTILDLAAEQRTDKQRAELLKWFAPRDPNWAELSAAEQEHLQQAPQPDITKIFAARPNGATYNFGADTRKVYFLARGNSNSKQGLAPPGFLRVLTHPSATPERWLQGAGDEAEDGAEPLPPRIALARWLTDVDQGAGALLARVIVNRLWQHHLGRGIVATPSDFGSQGAAPTHPELLDYLAGELVRHQWRLKPVHKLIVTSAVYRQSGAGRADAAQRDPDNRLWWRRGSQRLEAEAIRDALLHVSGELDSKMFGPGSLDQASPRRSIYLTVKRSRLVPFLQLFDAPDAIQSIGDRNVTTVPPQALTMMNSPLVRQLAEKFAQRLDPEGAAAPAKLVEQAYWLALSRAPRGDEAAQMTRFIDEQAASHRAGGVAERQARRRAAADFCQIVFCLNEFVFVD